MKTDLSLVIPAYNEEERIGKTLKKVIPYLRKNLRRYEIIVVDDGSEDKTADIAKRFKVRLLKNGRNRGKGYSVRRGMLAAKYPYILFSDADLSTPIEELKRFQRYIKSHDIIIGSRNMPGSEIQKKQPLIRSTLGKIFPLFVNLLVIRDIKDTQCGFKLMSRKAAQDIMPRLSLDGFAFDVELLYIAKKKGYKIKEIPVRWINDTQSRVSLFSDPVKMFLSLIRIRLRKK